MSQGLTAGGSLHDILRHSVPGYLLVILAILPFVSSLSRLNGTLLAAIIATAGPVVGVILFNAYAIVLRNIVWSDCSLGKRARKCLGVDHIDVLKSLRTPELQNLSDPHDLLAIWDMVFFTKVQHAVKDRGFVLFSRAHFWGVQVLGLPFVLIWWFVARCLGLPVEMSNLFYFEIGLAVILLVIALVLYPQAYKQGGALDFELVTRHIDDLRSVARELSSGRRNLAIQEPPPHFSNEEN